MNDTRLELTAPQVFRLQNAIRALVESRSIQARAYQVYLSEAAAVLTEHDMDPQRAANEWRLEPGEDAVIFAERVPEEAHVSTEALFTPKVEEEPVPNED